MADQPRNVLFLCSGNSARSIFTECLVNHLGQGRFRGYSAGSHPKGDVLPLTIRELQRNGLRTDGLRSKDMAEFEGAGAPQMDFVLTVCDQAAAEACPVWPGHPMTAHWGVEAPAAANGDNHVKETAFAKMFQGPRNRVEIFVNLPFESLSNPKLKEKLDGISRVALANHREKGSQR